MTQSLPTVPKAPPTRIVRFAQRIQRGIASFAERMSPPPFAILDLVMSRWVGDALATITRLGVAEALADGPRDVASLAGELGLHEASLYRVLRALARKGLIDESKPRTFALTELTRPLLAGHAHSIRNMVLEITARRNVDAWARLDDAVRTGDQVWSRIHDVDMWTYLDRHPEEHAVFHGAMVELTREAAPSYARALDYGSFGTICDLGGGEGQLLASILSVHAAAKGVLVDAPKVIANAGPVLARFGVRDRCELVPGNVFEWAPPGHGLYLAKNIVHGMSDDVARNALSAWREAMPDDARLVLIDVVVPEADGPYLQWLDLQMLLVSFGGRERTRAEFASLLQSGGFELEKVVETPTPLDLLVAKKRP